MAADRAALLAVVAATALLVWPAPSPVARRLRAVGGRARAPAGPPHPMRPAVRLTPGRRRAAVAVAAGLGVAVLLGGVPGAAAGLGTAVAAERALRRSAAAAVPRAAPDLPLACDLLAVCLSAGLPLPQAVAAVADVVAGPLRPALEEVAGRYRLGAEPAQAWADVPAELSGVARALVRAGSSGSAVVRTLGELAADERAVQRALAEAAVRRAGVQLLAPLGACFLPAFVCLGVVPLVLGIAHDVLG